MDYLDIEQAAKRLGRSTKTLRRWIAAHKIDYQVRNGKYLFSEADLEAKRTEASPDRMDNAALLDRIERVEVVLAEALRRLSAIEEIVQKQAALLRPAPATHETAKPAPSRPRPTKLVHNGGELPGGLVGFRQFADLHNIAQSTVQRAIESGRLDIVRGHWKQGRAWVEMALDAAGRQHFYELFSATNPGFKRCGKCPHNV